MFPNAAKYEFSWPSFEADGETGGVAVLTFEAGLSWTF